MDTHGCVVFDAETKWTADDVGGWHDPPKMHFAHACAHIGATRSYRTYFGYDPEREDTYNDINIMLDDLDAAALVIGFNIIDFDYKLLAPYAKERGISLVDLPTFDLLDEIGRVVGRPKPVSLESLASWNLGPMGKKTEDPKAVAGMYRKGYIEEVTYYCRHDVWMTRMLFLIGLHEGKLYMRGKRNASYTIDTRKWKKKVERLYQGDGEIVI